IFLAFSSRPCSDKTTTSPKRVYPPVDRGLTDQQGRPGTFPPACPGSAVLPSLHLSPWDWVMPKNTPLAAPDPAEAWRPWQPDERHPWDLKWAGHVYRRLAFSPNWAELQQALKDDPEATLERLLRGGPGQEGFE